MNDTIDIHNLPKGMKIPEKTVKTQDLNKIIAVEIQKLLKSENYILMGYNLNRENNKTELFLHLELKEV